MKYGKKLRMASSADGKDKRLMHWCPGCDEPHGIRIVGGPPTWSFNNNYDTPNFSPSVLCYTTDPETQQRKTLCHYFIRTGAELLNRDANLDPNKSYIDYCGDSPHALAGKIIELPDWPYAPGMYGGIEE